MADMENDPVFKDIERWADETRRAQGLPTDAPVVLMVPADMNIGFTLERELASRHIRISVSR